MGLSRIRLRCIHGVDFGCVKIWSSEEVDFRWVEMRQLNFVVCGPKFIFLWNAGRIAIDQICFQLSISSGDIRDRSLKLSEIATPVILHPQILRVQAPKNVYPNLYPCLATHHVDKFGEVIPTDPKVIRPNTLNCAPS